MKLFDLHCDTLTELYGRNENLLNCTTAVSLSGMNRFEKISRAFAIFIPDSLDECKVKEHYDNLLNTFKFNKSLVSPQNPDIDMFLTVENGRILQKNLKNVEMLKKDGVKVLTITWNGENEIGFGQLKNAGLKDFGIDCVKELEKNNIVIDVSHLSDKGFSDVCKYTTKPFVATHSNCRKICNHKRNLTDEQLKEIIKREGLVGLNFYHTFLNNSPQKASCEDVLRHAEHILALGGESTLCIGTDFDGAEIIRELDRDEKLLNLEALFLNNGFGTQITEKILYQNASRFYANLSY